MSEPVLFVIGATHRNAPLEVREKLSISAEPAFREQLSKVPGLKEVAILATCNRVEFYGVGEAETTAEHVQAAFCSHQGFEPSVFEKIRIRLTGREAALHLFEVASGLDSQLLGENEIFGQVKEAYAASQASGTVGAVLNRVFQKAFQAAKHVRSSTGISSGTVSIANVSVDLATNIFGSIDSVKVLVVGTGEIGSGTAKAFRSRGTGDLTVTSRTAEHATEVAATLGAATIPYEQKDARMADYDIVVSCTSAPTIVIGKDAVHTAMRRRPARPLLLVDLAMPRDIDAAVADLQNVYLYNLDDLAKIAEESRAAREAEAQRGRAILAERVDGLWRHVQERMSGARLNGNPPSA
jgi:glutamyl-tRNA reductase